MRFSFKLLITVTSLTLLSMVTYAAQELKKPAYKPKENQSTVTEGTTILIFKVPVPESNNTRKAGRAERTTSIPNINRLKADTRKTAGSVV